MIERFNQRDVTRLVEQAGRARVVLIGEASHGTEEFYGTRAELTRLLIEEKGFNAVAVEADWPDAYRAGRWAKGQSDDSNADESLSGFKRFPTWMWRNTQVVEFLEWLHRYNEGKRETQRVGFYGLDLYSLFASMEEVIRYLDETNPEAAKTARGRYSCFDHFGGEAENYALLTTSGELASCEHEVVEQLIEMVRGRPADNEAFFDAQQNARLVMNAERYYRTMFRAGVSSWNLRDQHMFEILQLLVDHLDRTVPPAKVVVWEHNSHIGDARSTEMGWRGELNVGQLARQMYEEDCYLIGFSTFTGTVLAASFWGGAPEVKEVRPALEGSVERFLHDDGEDFITFLRDKSIPRLKSALLERAIGVIYKPETERQSHYFEAIVGDQFDALIHIDQTNAVSPLESPQPESIEIPETYPSNL